MAEHENGTGVMRMAVRGSELKATDIVESVDDPDSRTQLEADIQAWLCANVGISVWLTDVVEHVHGWLDRQAAITERECANTRVNFAERIRLYQRGYDDGQHGRGAASAPDSREMLEADVWAGCEHLTTAAREDVLVNVPWAKLLDWLDRAADIREREFVQQYCAECETAENAALKDDIAVLREERAKLQAENDELKSKLNYLEGHGVEIVDAVAGGYEVYNEWHRKAKELKEAMAMDSRIRAQQSDAVDNLARQRDELLAQVERLVAERDEAVEAYDAHMAAHDAWHEAEDITYTRNRFAIYEQATKERIARLESERDALADDLKECMEERDYWRQEVQFCMDAAYPPSHAPERPYDPRVMAYPDREGCTTPSTLVSAMIDGLRDDIRDTVMPIVEESANAKADCERWREACGSMLDAAHEIQRIIAEMELK